ncbi:MAG: hypothetical protein EOL95_05305 [Bacteroidia bacterium]|nr:hypothetical protein [Bacteroidia bacterium]
MKQELLHHVKNQSNVRNLSGFGLFNGMAKSLKFALLSLVFILLGFVFGTQDVQAATYPASQTVYVESSSDYGTVKLYAWGGTYSNPGWCGETMTSLGLIGSKYYWSITLNGTFTSMIVCDNSCTKISGNTDGVASDGTTTNCITVTGSSYSWKLFNCTSYSDCPSNVLTGTNVMFYINQSYGGTLGITNNSSSSCIANGTNLGNNNAYINMAKASVPGTMSVSNNCGGWVGTGAFSRSTAYNAGNYFVTGDSKSNTSATTASLSASSTSIAAGTSSINITSTAGSVNSSFGKKLAIQYYISTTKYGCDFANTSGVATTINTSSLSQGTYKIKSVLTDGTIYYLGDSINLYVTPSPFTFGTINRTSCTTANLAWSANAPALLVRYEGSSPSITNPTHGQSYSSGNTIGAGTVVYSGTSDNYTATFDADKIYTFVIYRVSASGYLYSTSASTTLPKGVPTVTTTAASSIDATSATLGGNVTAQGVGGAMSNRGIEWTLTVGGKTAGDKEIISTENATGTFSKSFTGLTSSTTYKYKAIASNNSCSSTYGYGAEESFTTSTSCTTPTATQYTLSDNSKTYTGSSLSPTITPASGAGTVSKVYYNDVEGTGATTVGSYTIKVDVNAGTTYCAATGISLGTFTINKADQASISIDDISGTLCVGAEYELSVTGGSGTGTVTYTKESGDATATITGNKITFTSSGTYKIKAVKAADTNYNESSAAYTSDLTINAGSVGGTATATASSVCSGSGTTITLTGNTGTIQWQSSTNGTDYSDISGATSSPLSTGNLTVKTWYRATVTNGSCGSANSSVATVDITSVPTVSITSGPDKMCGSLTTAGTYTATSVTGASYTWSDDVEGLSEYSKTDNSVTFTTGAVVSSGKIYVYATLSGCNSNTAEKSVAIVTRPTVTGTTGASRCGTGTADISATVSGGSVDWYDAASAGTKKGSSASSANFTTASLSENTTFYAEANDGGCLSATRTAAAVTIKTSPVLSAISGAASTTQYNPETYTATGSDLGTITWEIVDTPAHANISATTGSSTVFKAKDGSYTLSVTANNDGCTDNETKGITVSIDSETCQ